MMSPLPVIYGDYSKPVRRPGFRLILLCACGAENTREFSIHQKYSAIDLCKLRCRYCDKIYILTITNLEEYKNET